MPSKRKVFIVILILKKKSTLETIYLKNHVPELFGVITDLYQNSFSIAKSVVWVNDISP